MILVLLVKFELCWYITRHRRALARGKITIYEMKNYVIVLISLMALNCKAQYSTKLIDLSQNKETNYIVANILKVARQKEIYGGGMFVKTFLMSDSKATPEGLFEGTDAIISSLLISVVPDGDYYSHSKLYKIECLVSPEVLEVIEIEHPKFSIKIEHGFINERKIELFEFEGVE